MKRFGIELVSAHSSSVRCHYNDVRIIEIHHLCQFHHDLVRGMKVLKMAGSEAVLYFSAVKVESDYPFYADILTHLTEQCCCKCLSSAFLMLPGIRICRQDKRDAFCSGKSHCIDCGEKEHQMVIDRK